MTRLYKVCLLQIFANHLYEKMWSSENTAISYFEDVLGAADSHHRNTFLEAFHEDGDVYNFCNRLVDPGRTIPYVTLPSRLGLATEILRVLPRARPHVAVELMNWLDFRAGLAEDEKALVTLAADDTPMNELLNQIQPDVYLFRRLVMFDVCLSRIMHRHSSEATSPCG